jgi:hypothetical protein
VRDEQRRERTTSGDEMEKLGRRSCWPGELRAGGKNEEGEKKRRKRGNQLAMRVFEAIF